MDTPQVRIDLDSAKAGQIARAWSVLARRAATANTDPNNMKEDDD